MSHPFRMTIAVLASSLMFADTAVSAQWADNGPLQFEAKILLGEVRGRIDHMALDLTRQRLFVAELGNDSVGVVDLANRSLIRTITRLNEPQGVGYEPSTDTLFVANARDGSVKLFEGNEYKESGRIELGSDADNVRIDASAKRVVVGYGDGGLAVGDPSTRTKIQNVSLKAHPESFQIVEDRIFVNLPDAQRSRWWTPHPESSSPTGRWTKVAISRWPSIATNAEFFWPFVTRLSSRSSPWRMANPSRTPIPVAMWTTSLSMPSAREFMSVVERAMSMCSR